MYGDLIMEWLYNILKNELNEHLSSISFKFVGRINFGSERLLQDIQQRLESLKSNEVLLIILMNPVLNFLQPEIVRIHDHDILACKFTCPRFNPEEIQKWIKTNSDQLGKNIDSLIKNINKIDIQKKVRFMLLLHPMMDFLQHFRAVSDLKINEETTQQYPELRAIAHQFIADNINLDSYLYAIDQNFKLVNDVHPNMNYSSLALKFTDHFNKRNYEEKYNRSLWINLQVSPMKWEIVSFDGLCPNRKVYEYIKRWIQVPYYRYTEHDIHNLCHHVFNLRWHPTPRREIHPTRALLPPAQSSAEKKSSMKGAIAKITSTESRTVKFSDPIVIPGKVTVALETVTPPRPSSMPVDTSASSLPTSALALLSLLNQKSIARNLIQTPSTEVVSTNILPSISTSENESIMKVENLIDLSDELVEKEESVGEEGGATALSPTSVSNLNLLMGDIPAFAMSKINVPTDDPIETGSDIQHIIEEIELEKMFDDHELVLVMKNPLAVLSTPTLYMPNGYVNIKKLSSFPEIPISSMGRDLSYLRSILVPFTCIINPSKWFTEFVVENSISFDFHKFPVCNRRIYLQPLDEVFEDAEVFLTSINIEKEDLFSRYIVTIQIYYKLAFFVIAHARRDANNLNKSSLECVKIPLRENKDHCNFFIYLEKLIIKTFYDLIEDILLAQESIPVLFDYYKKRMAEEFITHLELFKKISNLRHSGVLTGLSSGLDGIDIVES